MAHCTGHREKGKKQGGGRGGNKGWGRGKGKERAKIAEGMEGVGEKVGRVKGVGLGERAKIA